MNISSDRKMTTAATLWKNAEELICSRTPESPPGKEGQVQTLFYELQLHQIKLEMQNFELRNALEEAEVSLAKYADRHNCAISSYDITGRISSEDTLSCKEQKRDELKSSQEVRPARNVDDLRQVNKHLILQDRRAAMGEMISNIAHQWRQPLHVLGLQLQELPIVYSSDHFDREYLEKSVANSMQLIMHMSRTIDDFRNFFQFDKEKVPFNVNQVIGKTLALIGESFKNQYITIDIHQEGDPVISGYPNEYAQALMNILINSRDALIALDVVDARISIRTIKMGKTSVVTITDNAGGVADEIVDKLFDPYFTTKEPDKGTGIGLFMSKAIIEKNMAGKLTFQNIEGGAEFRIEV